MKDYDLKILYSSGKYKTEEVGCQNLMAYLFPAENYTHNKTIKTVGENSMCQKLHVAFKA